MTILKRSLLAATALGVGLAFATPGMAQVTEPPPAEQLARPDLTEDMQSAIRSHFETMEPAPLEPAPDGPIAVGEAVPPGVEPLPMPGELAAQLPPGEFGYFATGDTIVVIDMTDQTIAATIPRG